MAPKKKKSGIAQKTNEEIIDEVQLKFDLAQANERADMLKTMNGNLEEQYRKLDQAEQIMEGLNKKIDDLEDEKISLKDDMETKMILAKEEMQAKIDDLQASLDNVRHYIKKQQEVNDRIKILEGQLEEQGERHANEISLLDRKKAMEIDQLKKDMLQKIRETRDSLRLKTKDQLGVITKRTIMENEQMSTELQFQSKETIRLVDRNEKLIEENLILRRNAMLHKELEQELAKRTHVYQKLIKRLNAKLEEKNAEKIKRRMEATADISVSQKDIYDTDGNLAHKHGRHTTGGGGPNNDSVLQRASQGGGTRGSGNNFDEFGNNSKGMTDDQKRMSNVMGASLKELASENNDLKKTLHQSKTAFARYKRDHSILTQLQEQTAKVVVAALYDLKQGMEKAWQETGSLDEALGMPSGGLIMTNNPQQYNFDSSTKNSVHGLADFESEEKRLLSNDNHVFAQMTYKQREMFFRMLLDKINPGGANNLFNKMMGTTGESLMSKTGQRMLPDINQPSNGVQLETNKKMGNTMTTRMGDTNSTLNRNINNMNDIGYSTIGGHGTVGSTQSGGTQNQGGYDSINTKASYPNSANDTARSEHWLHSVLAYKQVSVSCQTDDQMVAEWYRNAAQPGRNMADRDGAMLDIPASVGLPLASLKSNPSMMHGLATHFPSNSNHLAMHRSHPKYMEEKLMQQKAAAIQQMRQEQHRLASETNQRQAREQQMGHGGASPRINSYPVKNHNNIGGNDTLQPTAPTPRNKSHPFGHKGSNNSDLTINSSGTSSGGINSSFRVNVVRGDVRGWGVKSSTMPIKKSNERKLSPTGRKI